jgi:hypothetical protein
MHIYNGTAISRIETEHVHVCMHKMYVHVCSCMYVGHVQRNNSIRAFTETVQACADASPHGGKDHAYVCCARVPRKNAIQSCMRAMHMMTFRCACHSVLSRAQVITEPSALDWHIGLLHAESFQKIWECVHAHPLRHNPCVWRRQVTYIQARTHATTPDRPPTYSTAMSP